MKQYRDIFFDLDQTLWDFEQSSLEVLNELFEECGLHEKLDFIGFMGRYRSYNQFLWDSYGRGLIGKETIRNTRFEKVFREMGMEDAEKISFFSLEYVKRGPYRKNLMPGALETLDYLKEKYHLHIITNGFEDVQHIKLGHCGLKPYFKTITTSESSGYRKPQAQMFYHSLESSGAFIEHSIMVGDQLQTDILGAAGIGMDQVFLNTRASRHSENPTYEIRNLTELKSIL